jgi:CheY-like chemotaxis protein
MELPHPTFSGTELMERLRAELAVDGIVHPVAAMVLEVTADAEPASEAQASAAVLELFTDRVAQPVASPAAVPIRPTAGVAAKQAEAFHRAAGKAQAAERHWTSHRSRRPRQRRASGAQQMLAFCE